VYINKETTNFDQSREWWSIRLPSINEKLKYKHSLSANFKTGQGCVKPV
jgi:hypothetical protein